MIHRLFATKADRIDEAAALALHNPLARDAALLSAAVAAAPVDMGDNRIAAIVQTCPEAFVSLAQLAGDAPVPIQS
jgi:hypothetical protein